MDKAKLLKPGSGGKRPGAGRKPMGTGRKITTSVMLSPEGRQSLDYLKSEGVDTNQEIDGFVIDRADIERRIDK